MACTAPAAPSATKSFSISMRMRSADRLESPARPVDAGEIAGAVGLALPVGGMDAEEAQDAQIILGDALAGVADEAHASGFDIGQPADMVMHDAAGIDGKPVDGEVAPFRVANPVAPERNFRLAPESLGILAQGRDLERAARRRPASPCHARCRSARI